MIKIVNNRRSELKSVALITMPKKFKLKLRRTPKNHEIQITLQDRDKKEVLTKRREKLAIKYSNLVKEKIQNRLLFELLNKRKCQYIFLIHDYFHKIRYRIAQELKI